MDWTLWLDGSTIESVAALGVVVALLALGVLYQRIGASRDRTRFPAPGSLIDVGGRRVHAVCRGHGSPTVLLESGIASSSLSWAIVQPEISKFARVCAYDRAGLGWSDAAASPRTLDGILDDLAAVIAHVGDRERLVLVGHSFGSLLVRAYAARHPEHIAGIVLVDPPTEWLTMTPERARVLRGGRFIARIGAWLARLGIVRLCLALLTGGVPAAPRGFVKVFGPRVARTVERLVGEVRKLPPDVHPLVQSLWCQPKCFEGMASYFLALEREHASLEHLAPPREIPIVVISGGDQSAEIIAAHTMLSASSANGRHVIARQSAHWVQFDEPQLIVEAVRDLVMRVV